MRALAALLAVSTAFPTTAQAQEAGEGTDWDVTVPRGQTREISFTTDEGTWMSVDVSPDGRTLVMDLVGEIWALPMGGGEARPLTSASGIALNYHPAFSPDGSRIAFISDRDGQDNVWTVAADGSDPRQVSHQRDDRMALPAWSPDGQYLFARVGGDSNVNGRGSLWMWHADGGEGVRLTPDEVNASWPEPSPDGRYLYYEVSSTAGVGGGDPANAIYQLQRLDRATGRVLPVTSGTGPARDGGGGRRSSGGAIAPAVSPDGRWLAFGRRIADGTQVLKGHEYGPRTALWIRDLETGAERIVMDPITPDVQERNNAGALPRHAWTPDSRSIVLTEGGRLRRLDVESGRVETIPFTATVSETISEQVYAPFRVADGPLSVRLLKWHTASPDGRRLAFGALDRIWLMDLPRGTPRPLLQDSFRAQQYSPSWSPDGRSLAFTSWSDDDAGHVWTVPAAGGEPRRVSSSPGMYLNPAWSADGGTVVAARGSGEMLRGRLPSDEAWFRIEAFSVSGGEPALLAEVTSSGRSHVVAPEFGPDGRVFFLEPSGSGRGAPAALKSVRADGSDPRTHVLLPASDQAAPSPDGRWLAFQRGDNMYLAPLPWPGAGGEPVQLSVDSPSLPVQRLSLEGGNYPNWTSASTLEWGSANRYFRHRVDSGTTDTVEVRLEVPRAVASGTIALSGARIVTMVGDRVIERGDVLVRGGRIVGVGAPGSVSIPGDAERVDARGMTIIPGLIDVHKHATREGAGVLSQRSWELAANLAYGVTTALEPSGWHETVFTMAEGVEAGVRTGPRMYSTASALSGGTTTRHGDVKSPEDALHEVRRLVSYGAKSIKQYWQPRRDRRQWVVEASREMGVMVTSEGDTDHLSTLGLVMDGHTGTEHPILNIPLYRDVTEFLGQANFFYSPTLVVGGVGPWGEEFFYQEQDLWKVEKLQRFIPWRWLEPHTRRRYVRPFTDYPFPLHAQGAWDVVAAGGHATIGAHGQLQGIDSHFEIWMFASAMPPMEALKTATVHAAQMIGVQEDVGSIAVGRLADLVVLGSSPLDDIRATTDIRYVMKSGVLYDGDTLNELWPEERPFGDFYWRVEGVRGPSK